MNRTRLFGTTAVAGFFLASSAQAQQATLAQVLNQATEYVQGFLNRFAHVVAEERYTQDFRTAAVGRQQHRDLLADVLLVRMDDATGESMVFRDVYEVDRSPVRDRDDRLAKLFLESPATARMQAEAITRDSARFNIGTSRTINNPLLPLALLQQKYRSRFSYSLERQDRLDGIEVSVLACQERVHPTLLRGTNDREVPIRGMYWIDRIGRVLKAEVSTYDYIVKSTVTVIFRFDERFQICVPVLMDEDYETTASTTRATARYDRFREFEVKTQERLK